MKTILDELTADGKTLKGKTDGNHWLLELDDNSKETGVTSVVTLVSESELKEYFNKIKISGNSLDVIKMIQFEKKELIKYKIVDLAIYLDYIRRKSGEK